MMTKVVFHHQSFNLFSLKRRIIGELVEVSINNEGFILVSLKNKPSVPRAGLMPHIRQGASNTNEMRYGL